MSEDRRFVPGPEPLEPAPAGPELVPPRTSTEPPLPSSPSIAEPDAPPTSRTGRDSLATGRRRARLTLRIPDDEITRPKLPSDNEKRDGPPSSVARPPTPLAFAPQPVAPPPAAVPQPAAAQPPAPQAPVPPAAPTQPSPSPPPVEAAVLVPMRIITISPPPPTEPTPSPPTDDWASPEPSAAAEPAPPPKVRAQLLSEELIPIDTDSSAAADAPLEPFEDTEGDADEPTPRPRVPTDPDHEEEIAFEDEALTPAVPAVAGVEPLELEPLSGRTFDDDERASDPASELGAEDLLAIEASPPMTKQASLPPMRAALPSHPPVVPPPSIVKKAPPPAPGPMAPPAVVVAKAPLVIVPPHVGTLAPPVVEGPGLRRKGRLWWEDLFNDDYLRACEKLTDEQIAREVDFIEDSLSIERGGALLDLACGTGRHAIELARRGYEVVGFDLSLAMLARAGDEAQDREAKLNFIQGDMREMTFDEQFDGVYCWNTSFGYFEEDKNAGVIDRVHKSLRGGGLLLLDVINRDFLIRQSPSLAWFEGDGCVCMDEMSVDFITSRMKVKRTMMLDDGRSREIEYSMRVYSLHELGKILHEHGFKVCEVSGRVGTPGVFFGNESPRTIILAEKR